MFDYSLQFHFEVLNYYIEYMYIIQSPRTYIYIYIYRRTVCVCEFIKALRYMT